MSLIQKQASGLHGGALLSTSSGKVAVVFSAVVLLAVSARVQIPFWPVPMTLQTLTVLLIGHFLGFRLAVATIVAYLFCGAVGLPMFAGTPERGLGLAYMAGPTGGYLVGFVAAGAIASQVRDIRIKFGPVMVPVVLMSASIAIHLVGLIWLSKFVGFENAIQLGVLPFVLGDLLKVGIATAACFLLPLRHHS